MTTSHDLFEAARRHIPGGVNSPVRAFKGVGGDPVFFDSAAGPFVFDASGQRYIDYVGSWGPMILGHAHPEVIDAVGAIIHKGLSFGAPTMIETEMADKVCELVPSMHLVRMVSSGTEATMSAIRLARQGFEVNAHYRRMAGFRQPALMSDDEAGAIFLREGEVPEEGARIVQTTVVQTEGPGCHPVFQFTSSGRCR